MKKVMADKRPQTEMPFDDKPMLCGGFQTIVDASGIRTALRWMVAEGCLR